MVVASCFDENVFYYFSHRKTVTDSLDRSRFVLSIPLDGEVKNINEQVNQGHNFTMIMYINIKHDVKPSRLKTYFHN